MLHFIVEASSKVIRPKCNAQYCIAQMRPDVARLRVVTSDRLPLDAISASRTIIEQT
jgi:hypothetical protein